MTYGGPIDLVIKFHANMAMQRCLGSYEAWR